MNVKTFSFILVAVLTVLTFSELIIFNEETPIKLIELIKPDVLIKGGDYKIDEIVGAEFIQQNGGRVVLSDYKKGHSTSDIIKKIES